MNTSRCPADWPAPRHSSTAPDGIAWRGRHQQQLSTQIDKAESVQRRFTKRLRGYSHLDYPSRLNALALTSLEKRRLVQDLVLTYKISPVED